MFKKFFAKRNQVKTEISSASCPNCWGNQAYGETYVKGEDQAYHQRKQSITTLGWIQAYFENRLA